MVITQLSDIIKHPLEAAKAGKIYARAKDLYDEEEFSEAVKLYRQFLKIYPIDSAAWNEYGNTLDQLDRNTEALEAYKMATNLDPSISDYWYNKGNVLHDLGKTDQAIDDFKTASKLNPEDTDIWESLGDCYVHQDNFRNALDVFSKALMIDSENDSIWAYRAIILMERGHGDYKEQIFAINKAIQIEPEFSSYRAMKCEILLKSGKFGEAMDAVLDGLHLDPNDEDCHKAKALVQLALNRISPALKSIEKAIEIYSYAPEYWLTKAKILTKLKRYEDAIDSLIVSYSLEPTQMKRIKEEESFEILKDNPRFKKIII